MIKLVRQEVQNIGHVKSYKDLEKIGRLCYRSEDKITEDSYIKFIKKILENGHLSVLEHLNIIFEIQISEDVSIDDYFDSPFIIKTKFDEIHEFGKVKKCENYFIVSGSLRAFYEHLSGKDYFLILRKIFEHLGNLNIFDSLYERYDKIGEYERDRYLFERILEFNILNENDLLESSNEFLEKHLTHTFFIVCNRGISHEYVRHRWTHAITQESTRFVKYDEVEIILPFWFYNINSENEKFYKIWLESCSRDALTYQRLLKMGISPQKARDNLPHSLRTSLYSTMSLSQWKHFLKVRKSKPAQPLIRGVSDKIKEYLKVEYPKIFD